MKKKNTLNQISKSNLFFIKQMQYNILTIHSKNTKTRKNIGLFGLILSKYIENIRISAIFRWDSPACIFDRY